jgi:hypothetical protein
MVKDKWYLVFPDTYPIRMVVKPAGAGSARAPPAFRRMDISPDPAGRQRGKNLAVKS